MEDSRWPYSQGGHKAGFHYNSAILFKHLDGSWIKKSPVWKLFIQEDCTIKDTNLLKLVYTCIFLPGKYPINLRGKKVHTD